MKNSTTDGAVQVSSETRSTDAVASLTAHLSRSAPSFSSTVYSTVLVREPSANLWPLAAVNVTEWVPGDRFGFAGFEVALTALNTTPVTDWQVGSLVDTEAVASLVAHLSRSASSLGSTV